MPKAAVYKHNHTLSGEAEVRGSRDAQVPAPPFDARCSHHPEKRHFSAFVVLAADPRHHLRATQRRKTDDHLMPERKSFNTQ
jgi:hypothetical protein